jgi:hypothetical protein
METSETDPGEGWAPRQCTLPTAGRLSRAAEFDRFFAELVQGVERPERTRLRLELQPGPLAAGGAAELAAAETACCSFFTFTLTATAGRLVLDVAVPAAHLQVLDALADRAAASLAD